MLGKKKTINSNPSAMLRHCNFKDEEEYNSKIFILPTNKLDQRLRQWWEWSQQSRFDKLSVLPCSATSMLGSFTFGFLVIS